jgi:hypothetical protein
VLPLVWLILIMLAFAAGFHALDVSGYQRSLEMSGSSLFTLGSVRPPGLPTNLLSFLEAATGLAILALLIAYLPTIYGAFSRREVLVAQLSVRSGDPPSGVKILVQAHRMERFELLDDLWVSWQHWFAEVEETHTSLGVLSFFRSPMAHRSWITAAGAVLDAASLKQSAMDLPFDPEAGFCIRAGFFSLRAIAAVFNIPFDSDPAPDDPISITKEEFLEACDALVAAGLAVRADRDDAWKQFQGWRVNYDRALVGLAGLVMAPYAPWSSDRSISYRARFRMRNERRASGRPVSRPISEPAAAPRRGCADGVIAGQKIHDSGAPGTVSRRMNHSMPNTALNACSGMARNSDSASICDACAAMAARFASRNAPTSTTVVMRSRGTPSPITPGSGISTPSGSASPAMLLIS